MVDSRSLFGRPTALAEDQLMTVSAQRMRPRQTQAALHQAAEHLQVGFDCSRNETRLQTITSALSYPMAA
jgi:hypothetical protein